MFRPNGAPPPWAPRRKWDSRAQLEKELKQAYGPTARLQRIEKAGQSGVQVLLRDHGEDLVVVQTFETGGATLEAHAVMLALKQLMERRP